MSMSCLTCPVEEASSSNALLTNRILASCSSVAETGSFCKRVQLLAHEADGFDDALGRCVELDAEVAAVGIGVQRAIDAIDEATFLTQLLPQARLKGAAAAQNLVEHQEGIVIGDSTAIRAG